MNKPEVRRDLYTKTAYAKKMGESIQVVNYWIKTGKIKTLLVNGTTLVKAV